MDASDEIPLEDHRYFLARLDHLENQNPAFLLNQLEEGTLTEHLRELTARAMQAMQELTFNQRLPMDQADELVMCQVVADPMEKSRLSSMEAWAKLRKLLSQYKASLPTLTRTYQSETEITE